MNEIKSIAQMLKDYCKKKGDTECNSCPFYIEEIDYCGIRVPEDWILDTGKSEDDEWKTLLS